MMMYNNKDSGWYYQMNCGS